MDASIVIEEFRAEHADELVPMWRESFEFGVGLTDPHPLDEQVRYLFTDVAPNNAIRVARLENRIVGFIAASPTSISQLYVRRGFHRRGIGSRLLAWAKAQSTGTLWLYTFARNTVARAFYEHHGFKIVARGHEPTWKLDDLRYEWSEGAVETSRKGPCLCGGVTFREIAAADVSALFDVRTRTRENTVTLEQLQRHGINPQSVTEALRQTTKGWLCEDMGSVVAFSMADRATSEFLVIAVLPEYEGKGVGGKLMALAEEWLAASGCGRAWLTTDLDTSLRAYGFYRKRGWSDWKIERNLRYMELSLRPRSAR